MTKSFPLKSIVPLDHEPYSFPFSRMICASQVNSSEKNQVQILLYMRISIREEHLPDANACWADKWISGTKYTIQFALC